ncbi:unnamed protein product [Penicillium salamii]|uniref:Uncharacterized protein n=1 Tax=Penicillium salamii TaxID=1612424 RepID=A0A9W4N8C1_9EURO|nr:unnamed protein product [Penicillium salamii]CAG8289066.1 unnamed protein product [Penicillium salamii]CAG8420430.1 unnamed protein product [Penicillium salamii]CAG8420968.1 unnamed protein product [Penicillium salamii]
MFQGSRAILGYRRERDLLIRQVESYIEILRSKPTGNHLVEVTLNIRGLAMQANKVKWAAETLAVDAKDMKYVTSKSIGFFSHTIPARCNRLSADANIPTKPFNKLNQTLISRFRQARENLINLLDQQATFLRLDLEARQYVIPCLRRQIPQYIDILVTMSIMISNRSRHHPYVLFRRNLYGAMSLMYNPCRSTYVARFKEERAALRSQLRVNANALRACPQTNEEGLVASRRVSVALCGLVPRVYCLKNAAVDMDVKTRGNPFVLAKPYAFYSHDVPPRCMDIVASLLHWADMLVNRDGRRTDGIVIESIEYMLDHMEF